MSAGVISKTMRKPCCTYRSVLKELQEQTRLLKRIADKLDPRLKSMKFVYAAKIQKLGR